MIEAPEDKAEFALLGAAIGILVSIVVLFALTFCAKAESSIPYRLEWRFVTVISTGPTGGRTPERHRFKDMADCAAFGALHVGRMHDWVRGLIRADWNHPVEVAFDCKPVGDPA